jgi:hypothetical protein
MGDTMSNLSLFLKKNKIQKENAKYSATKSLCDEKGSPLNWEIKPISTKENEDIREACMIEVPVKGKPNMFRPKLISSKYIAKLMAASVVFPDLMDKELQDSYGVMTPEDLVQEMIDDPGEYNEFAAFVQKFNGFDTTMESKVEEAKN